MSISRLAFASCILVVLLAIVASQASCKSIPVEITKGGQVDMTAAKNHFEEFKKTFNKFYTTAQEHEKRFKIFTDNLNFVNQLNILHSKDGSKGDESVQYGITEFMDMTTSEFSYEKLMPLTKAEEIKHKPTAPKEKYIVEGGLPESFDWRDHGAVTPVKNQASCGSCWAFSTVQNIEGQYFLSGKPLTKFSPQQLVDCDILDCGCFGGYPYVAMGYIQQRGGLATEESYPYCIPPLGNCFPCNTNKTYCPSPDYCNRTCGVENTQLVAKIAGYENVSTNEDEIAAYLVNHGPLSVGLNAIWLQFYSSGISDPYYCPDDIDHAVLLVGYGVHTNILGEKTPYWIVKNSWGESWGEKGYFRIIRGKGKCGINTIVANALMK